MQGDFLLEALKPILSQGLLGIIVVVMFYQMRKDRDDHRDERKEWKETIHQAIIPPIEGNTKALNENTKVTGDLRACIAAFTGRNGVNH